MKIKTRQFVAVFVAHRSRKSRPTSWSRKNDVITWQRENRAPKFDFQLYLKRPPFSLE